MVQSTKANRGRPLRRSRPHMTFRGALRLGGFPPAPETRSRFRRGSILRSSHQDDLGAADYLDDTVGRFSATSNKVTILAIRQVIYGMGCVSVPWCKPLMEHKEVTER
jgi:hypothetical protein